MNILDKAKDSISGDKAEGISDKGLDTAAAAADKRTGDKHADKVQGARDAIDGRIGNDGASTAPNA